MFPFERTFKRLLLLLLGVFAAFTFTTCMGALQAMSEELWRPVVRDASVCPQGEILVVGLDRPYSLLPDDVLDVETAGRALNDLLLGLEWIYVDEVGEPVGEWSSNMILPCLVEAADA